MKRILWLLFALVVLFVVPMVSAQAEEPPIVVGDITPASVIAFLAVIMSLVLDYAPGIATWYEKLSESSKKLFTLGLTVFIVGTAFALTCANVITTNLVCSRLGAWDALTGVIYVIAIQYGFHKATKPSTAFKKESYLNMKTTSKGH